MLLLLDTELARAGDFHKDGLSRAHEFHSYDGPWISCLIRIRRGVSHTHGDAIGGDYEACRRAHRHRTGYGNGE